MSNAKSKTFRKNLLTTAITIATATSAHAGIVRGDVDYQYFRDFAENKGEFGLNATNVAIVDKDGNSVGTMLQDIPMIDLAVGSRGTGYATLVKPQYVVSVQHNVGYQDVQFGDHSDANPDSHHFSYQITDRHIKAPGVGINSWHRDDYHSPRLHKLVTEVAPIATADETSIHAYLDKEKYPTFVRSGSGRQMALDKGNIERNVAGTYQYVTGGSMLDLIEVVSDTANIPGNTTNTLMRIKGYDDMFNHPLGIMQKSGDSGSGVFAWDAKAQRWVYVMSVQSSTNSNSFSIAHLGYVDDNEKKAIAGEIIANAKNLIWTPVDNTSTITGGQDDLSVDLADPALLERDGNKNAQGIASNQWHRPRQNAGKTFTITGDDNVLTLSDSINQGSGAIYFKGNTTVAGVNAGTTWLGAGVSIDKDKTLTWKIGNPLNDRLSKLGEGTMLVQGTGKNLGSISVGEGKVILDQKADSQGQKQAFDEVGIVSGRPTVVLNSSDQVNPNNIYFGFRGGRLDVNGNDLTFNRIQNADNGAKIVNHNMNDSATINLERSKQFAGTGDAVLETNHAQDYQPTGFYAQQRADGTTDYFVLKDGKTPNLARPTNKTDNNNWQYLTSGTKEEAIRAFLELKQNAPLTARKDTFSGMLGESDDNKNGRLDVNFNPTLKDDVYMLNGGANLNGTLAVKNATMVLSGVPTPHAYDHINKKEVIDDHDWIDREFKATTFEVTNGTLKTGRNVAKITGDIHVSGTGIAHIGYVTGDEVLTRTRTGATVGEQKSYNNEILTNILGKTKVDGNISLQDTAELRLNTQFNHNIHATANTNTRLEKQAHWTMPSSQIIGHLDGDNGQITLNPRNQETIQTGDNYNTLTVKGNLDGYLQFNYLSDLANKKSDKLVVEGYATGSHTLAVKNTGSEANIDKLTLVELKHQVQNADDVSFHLAGGYVDAGAYRYTLKHDTDNTYYLANPKRASELAKLRAEEAKKADEATNKAKQALADAQKARQDAEEAKQRAEDALKTAQTSSISPEKLAEVQKLADNAQKLADEATLAKETAEQKLATAHQELTNAQTAKAEADRLKAEAEKQAQNAKAEQTRLETALNQANTARQTAEEQKTTAENARRTAEQQASIANLAKETAEAKQREAENKQQEAEKQRNTAQTALAEVNQQKKELEQQLATALATGNADTASLREQLAEATAQITEKEQALAQATTAKAQAENQKAEADRQKAEAQTALALAQTALNNANEQRDQANAQARLAEAKRQAVEQNLSDIQAQLSQAQDDKQTAEQKARDAENAKTQAEQARRVLEQAQATQTQALKDAQDALKVAQLAKDEAEKQKQASDLAKQQADAEAKRQADLAKQAQAEKDRQTEIARQAEIAKQQAQIEADRQAQNAKSAETAQKVAELNAQNAQHAQKLAEEAKHIADTARQKVEEANVILDEANKRLQATINADATIISQAQADLAVAQKLADERQAILTLAETNLKNTTTELQKIRQENSIIENQLQQETALRNKAETAQAEAILAKEQANQARLEAIEAKTKSDTEKQQAEIKLAQAEKLAEQKQAEADQAKIARLDLTNQLNDALARLQGKEADLILADTKAKEALSRQKLAEAELAELKAQEAKHRADELAKQQSQAKQAEIISQYANLALSEVSAVSHHLHRASDRIDDRLHQLNGKNSGFWLQTDSEKSKHTSDQYRGFEQNSQLTQIGMDKTVEFGTGDLTLGASLNHLRYSAYFEDDFTVDGKVFSGSLYGKWQHDNGFAITSDITTGQAVSDIQHNSQLTDIKRSIGSVGIGIEKSFDIGNVDVSVHTGVKHHYVGDVEYDITTSDNSQATIQQDNINITSYQTGANLGKTIQTANGLNIRPSVGVNYRHTNSEGKVAVNDQILTQKFANELQGQIGVVIGKNNWEVNVQADYADNNESGDRSSAMLGVNWKW